MTSPHDTKGSALPPCRMLEPNYGLSHEPPDEVYQMQGGIMEIGLGEVSTVIWRKAILLKNFRVRVSIGLWMVFWNLCLMVNVSGHALCITFPSSWLLDFFCFFYLLVFLHPWSSFGIHPFGFWGFSFSKWFFPCVFVTLFWEYGSLVLLGINHSSLLDYGSRELWTFHTLVVLCGLWCNGPFPMSWI